MLPSRVIVFSAAVLAAGAVLVVASLALGVPTGWIGAAGLIGWAFAARRRWARLAATTGMEPGGPERVLWIRLAGVGLLLGHLVTALAHVDVDFHVGQGNFLAVDSWTMLAALFVVLAFFRSDGAAQDERHAAIAARGVRAGFATLIALLVVLSFYLGFAPPPARAVLTHWLLSNLFIALILAAYLVQLAAQLASYGRDTLDAGAADAFPDEPPE